MIILGHKKNRWKSQEDRFEIQIKNAFECPPFYELGNDLPWVVVNSLSPDVLKQRKVVIDKDAIEEIHSKALLKENISMINFHSESLEFFCKFLVQFEEAV